MILKFRETHIGNIEKERKKVRSPEGGGGGGEMEEAGERTANGVVTENGLARIVSYIQSTSVYGQLLCVGNTLRTSMYMYTHKLHMNIYIMIHR